MGSAGEWSLLVESLAQGLVPALRRRLYQGHLDRMATIRSYSEKLVYLYVVLADRGFLVLDDRFLYWVTET